MKSMVRPRGPFVARTTCRFCDSTDLVRILDFGDVPLAGAFLKEGDFDRERFYPLEIKFCRNCTLVQVSNAVSADVLFKHYFYFSSAIKTLVTHFKDFAGEIVTLTGDPARTFVVEIGCNDGVLLKPLMALGAKAVGVDPATNVVESSGLSPSVIVNDCFTEEIAGTIRREHGRADVIASSYSFAHIDDMADVMRGIQTLLKDEGVFLFEVYYLGIMVDELQYDMIYHEHMSYYALTSLSRFMDRFGMEIVDLKRIPLRAGTIRFYARKKGTAPVSQAMRDLQAYEQERRLDREETYIAFGESVAKTRTDLMGLLRRLKAEGKQIIGYGASGRATTIMNYCGIDTQYLDYVVDDAPAKHGFYTPGTHIPIRPWPAEGPLPDYVLVFAWSFIEEVKKRRADYLRQGGRFIVPLPGVNVITG